MHLEEFYANLTEITSERTGKPLSAETIRHYHRCISAILADATRKRIIPRNPASREFMNTPQVPKKAPVHLDDEQAQRFVMLLLNEEDLRKKAAFMLLIYSGCRIGELTGLEWADISFDTNTIAINRASQFVKGHGIITKSPKNNTSVRTIKLPAFVFETLAAYRKWYLQQRLVLGDKWVNSDRLFTQWNGSPITPTAINKWLSSFVEFHGLPKITPHGLRHTNISLLISNGVDVRTVAHKAGHSRATTTLSVYSHVLQSADEAATQTLDNLLTPKTPDLSVYSG